MYFKSFLAGRERAFHFVDDLPALSPWIQA